MKLIVPVIGIDAPNAVTVVPDASVATQVPISGVHESEEPGPGPPLDGDVAQAPTNMDNMMASKDGVLCMHRP
jgi:hypothetical protein